METLQLILKIGGIFIPALVSLLIYIYNRQLKSIFHQINENKDSIKELYEKTEKNTVTIAEHNVEIENIEELCKLKHKE